MRISKPLAVLAAVVSLSILGMQTGSAGQPDKLQRLPSAKPQAAGDRIQQQAQKSDHGLDRDLIRRSKTPETETGKPAASPPAAPRTPAYKPVITIKPKGLQPAAGRSVDHQPQPGATSFGVLLDGKSDDGARNSGKPKGGFAPRPQALQGIEPDEIDVK